MRHIMMNQQTVEKLTLQSTCEEVLKRSVIRLQIENWVSDIRHLTIQPLHNAPYKYILHLIEFLKFTFFVLPSCYSITTDYYTATHIFSWTKEHHDPNSNKWQVHIRWTNEHIMIHCEQLWFPMKRQCFISKNNGLSYIAFALYISM